MRKYLYSFLTILFLTFGIVGYAYQDDVRCAAGFGCTVLHPIQGGEEDRIPCEETCATVCESVEDCSVSIARDLQSNCECRCDGMGCEVQGGPCRGSSETVDPK